MKVLHGDGAKSLRSGSMKKAVEPLNGSQKRFRSGLDPQGKRRRVICRCYGRKWLCLEFIDDEFSKQARPWDTE